jgi:DNA primase
MAGRIPPEFIDQLLARIDIVDVIDRRVPLKKAGAEFQALCPFHGEKTPSFTVSPRKQFYHCFGCGAHGTAIGFLMDYEHLTFPEAVEELARDAGLEVPHEADHARGPDYGPVYETLARAAEFYRRQLRDHPAGGRAVEYLKARGLTGDIARAYGIGYAPPGWDNLIARLGNGPREMERLRLAGLVSEPGTGKVYDRFRDRVMFPIRDQRGRVIGFGGRVLGEDKPKYLNSPETPVFHKGRELYGLYEVRQALRDIPALLVVEGYMDAVALAQYGVRNVVATLGTATTAEHLERLFRVVPEVIFSFDGDRAGRDAAWKALKTALPALDGTREVRFLFLPEGEDPDSLVRKEGAEAFGRRLAATTPLSEFLLQRLTEEIDTGSLEGRARLAEAARPLLSKIPGGAFRDLLYQRLGEVTGLTRTGSRGSRTRAGARGDPRSAAPPSAVRTAIRLLLEDPGIVCSCELPKGWQDLDLPGVSLLDDLLKTATANPAITTAALIDRHFGTPAWEQLQKLAATPIDTPADGIETELAGALKQLSHRASALELEKLTTKRPTDLSPEEKQRLRELMRARDR